MRSFVKTSRAVPGVVGILDSRQWCLFATVGFTTHTGCNSVSMFDNDISPQKSVDFQKISSLAESIAVEFSQLPQVVAVALAGSQISAIADDISDLDFYVYVQEEISVNIRESIAKKFSDRIEINNQFWEPGDEWVDKHSGWSVDIMYRTPN
jgi:hypothetical protein